jgi:hypothetical protein
MLFKYFNNATFFFFDMFTQEGRGRFKLVISVSLGVIIEYLLLSYLCHTKNDVTIKIIIKLVIDHY